MANDLATPAVSPPHHRIAIVAIGCFLVVLLVINVPPFLCLAPYSEAVQYDLSARNVLRGGVHYRDAFDTNLPGQVWLHAAIRATFGWRSEVLRAFDVGIVGLIVALLVRWLPPGHTAWKLGLATVLCGFYLSTSEWTHCQRDTWMLLPALAALQLRCWQVERIGSEASATVGEPEASATGGKSIAGWAWGEGVLWASACWIKPFVAIPAAACWLVGYWQLRQATPNGLRRAVLDASCWFAGGLTAGAAGLGWLIASGAWPWFVEVFFDWNREYWAYRMDAQGTPHLAVVLLGLFPWGLVHAAAVPFAFLQLWRGCSPPRPTAGSLGVALAEPLPAAFYLAWMSQAVFLQKPFEYIQAPGILLALSLVARGGGLSASPIIRVAQGAVFALLLALQYPILVQQRLGEWTTCIREGSTPEVRQRLTWIRSADWPDLDRVAVFLRSQALRDGELTCFNPATLWLYLDLDLKPSTRYADVESYLKIFVGRHAQISADFERSPQRLLVCDLIFMDRFRARLEPPPATLASERWRERVVFRSGRFVVLRVSGAEMPQWLQDCFPL